MGPEWTMRVGGELPVEVRRDHIVRVVEERGHARVDELAAQFGVSEVTVRSDLANLERNGRIRRVRGGAVATSEAASERPFEEMLGDRADEKQRIGAVAARLLVPGETVLLDVGTTTTAVARAMVAREELREVVVFTNGLTIALELEVAIPRLSVVVTGGTLRPLQHSLVDPLADTVLDGVHADTVILGCNGVEPTAGVTNINLPEAAVKRRMCAAAQRRIVVADGSKLGRVSLAPLCTIDEVHVVVTSASADPRVVDRLRDTGVRVEVAR